MNDTIMRPISTSDFAGRELPTHADHGAVPMLQWVKIADLVVDESYQRPIYGAGRRNVLKIADNFRWSMFAPIVVSPVAGGGLAIIDGQHRTTAAALRGIEAVPAQVVIAGVVEQAKAFRAINGQVTRMHALQLHAAAVAAGDRDAIELNEVAAAAGVVILRTPRAANRIRAGETLSFGAIRNALSRFGREATVTALQCVVETKNNKPGLLSGLIIEGVVGAIAANHQWRDAGEALFRAFDQIDIAFETEEALMTRREKGVATHEILTLRLKERLREVFVT